jgi:heat shock protein HtpX
VPWCPVCEWNLDAYDRLRIAARFGWPPADRLMHRLAYRLNRRQFAALVGRPPGRSGPALARTAITAVSVLLWLFVLACLAGGGYLTIVAFGGPGMLIGLLLIGAAVLLRPRFGRLRREAWTVDRAAAPALFELIDSVAAASGTPGPQVVVLARALNAFTATVGLRRRRLLGLGLPLWAALSPQERVALLGHELGHFVNGDLRRGLLTQPAYEVLGRLANLLRPHRVLPSADSSPSSWPAPWAGSCGPDR